MKTETGTFTYTVPANSTHADAGKKLQFPFEYQSVENDADVTSTLASKEWTVAQLVDEKLKSNAMANARAKAIAPYQPDTKSPEELRELSIKTLVRNGLSIEVATKAVDSALALR